MGERAASSVAVRRMRRHRRSQARRSELQSNLKALLLAALMVALLVSAFENAGRLFGISDRALQSSVSGLVNTGGSCKPAGEGRWLCVSARVLSSGGYGYGGAGTYAIQQTSRGCWEARFAGHDKSQGVFAEFESKPAQAEGCLDLADYFSGDDGPARQVYLGD